MCVFVFVSLCFCMRVFVSSIRRVTLTLKTNPGGIPPVKDASPHKFRDNIHVGASNGVSRTASGRSDQVNEGLILVLAFCRPPFCDACLEKTLLWRLLLKYEKIRQKAHTTDSGSMTIIKRVTNPIGHSSIKPNPFRSTFARARHNLECTTTAARPTKLGSCRSTSRMPA